MHLTSLRFICRAPLVTHRILRTSFQPARALSISSMAAGGDKDTYHILKYNYVPDILEKRDPYRSAHLEGASKMAAAGKLAMAGAVADPVDGALFIFRNCDKNEIEHFVENDPYFGAGLITSHEIRPFIVVAGDVV